MALATRRLATLSETAEFFDVSIGTVQGWIRRGCPVVKRGHRGSGYQLDLLQVARWYFSQQRDSGDAEGPGDPDRMTPNDRLCWYRSEKARVELEVVARSLIPAGEVEIEMRSLFNVFTGFLSTLPDILERDCGLSAEAVDRAQAEIDRARDKLYVVLAD